jgi:CHAT domain-containing protein/tetratricopeptide (TPR) repeat protein
MPLLARIIAEGKSAAHQIGYAIGLQFRRAKEMRRGNSLIVGSAKLQGDLQRAKEGEQRYLRTGDRASLDIAVVAWQGILDDPAFAASDERFQVAVWNDAGGVCLRRYWAGGPIDDLHRALDLWQQAVARTPPDSPDLPGSLNNLGTGLSSRYARTGRLEDLEEAIRVYQQAVARTPPDSPDLPSRLSNLGTGLSSRYARTGRLEDLDEAIRVYQQAVARTPPDSPELPSLLNNLGTGLSDRYARTGRLEDLDEAIRVYQQAVARTPPDSPELPSLLNNLGTGLSDRYARTGRLENLEEAIRVYQQAVARTPPDSPDLPSFLNNLGNGRRSRYARTGRLEDLEEAIRVYQQAVARTPPDSPDLPMYLNNLGTGLSDRYARTGRLEDLEEAIRVYQQAVARTPPDSPDPPSRLSNLGTGLRSRYTRTGRLEDLEEAIRVYQHAVARTPPDSPDLPGSLNNLGTGLSDRYARTGRLEDLDEAIRVYQQAVARTPPDSPDLPSGLSNLGTGLRSRYARTGRLKDLEEAIRVHQQAVARTPPDSPDLPSRLSNLGNGLSDRYDRTGRLEDLEEAIRVYQQAVARTPPDSPDLPSFLNNLGNGLRSRYARTGRQENLEEAIRVYQQAVARTPPDSPDLPMYLNNLGTGLSDRYARTGRLEDLEEGRMAYRRAGELGLTVAPEVVIVSGRSWGHWAFERAAWDEAARAYQGVFAAVDRLLREQVLQTGKESWLREAQGVAGRAAYTLSRDDHPELAVVALEQGRVRLLAEALEHTRRDLELLPQQGHADAYRRFRDAAAAVQALQQLDRAGDVPEGFDRHQARQTARTELDAAILAIRAIAGFEDFLLAPDWERIQRTVTPEVPLVYLVTTPAGSLALIVRREPTKMGQAPFVLNGASPIFVAGTDRPDRRQSHFSATVTPVWLDEFREADLDDLLIERSGDEITGGYLVGQLGLGERDSLPKSLDRVLPLLGERLMGPLAERLRVPTPRQAAEGKVGTTPRRVANSGETPMAWANSPLTPTLSPEYRGEGVVSRPLLTLIPTGRLSLLPFHAARYIADGQDVSLLDEFTVTYAISATALAKARQESQTRSHTQFRLAGVGNPLPESAEVAEDRPGSLPFARAELESIADMLPDGAARAFYEHNATRQSLLDALPGANLVHLSCHGRFRADDPLESGLLLADGELTLRDIIAAGFTALAATRLAVLSACQTAIQDFRNLPDEAIGLPAGLTQAGVPSVLGTLWSVNDASTALLMVRFYELLLQDRLPPPVALRQAQLWLREATNAKLDAYLSRHEAFALARQQQAERMPLLAVHTLLGQVLKGDPNARPYSHPYYWAPFVFYGAEEAL